jgi:hypothetical protein
MAHADDEAWLDGVTAEAHQAIARIHQQGRALLDEAWRHEPWAPDRAVGQQSGWFEAPRAGHLKPGPG